MTLSFVRTAGISLGIALAAPAFPQPPDGAAIYAKHCARCHETDQTGFAERREVLGKLRPQAILAQLHLGLMSTVATLTDEEKSAVASYLTGKPPEAFRAPTLSQQEGLCSVASAASTDILRGPSWNGWSPGLTNSRFQPFEAAGITPEQIPRLKLKWAFGFPASIAAWSQPVVAGGRVFAGSINGMVYSLDARTGCTYWVYGASPAGVRAAITVGPGSGPTRFIAYVGDLTGTVHAVDAITGKGLWKVKVDDHPTARVTGAPQLHQGRLYVPVASLEEATAANPKYECCTFRGSVAALDAQTGRRLWKTYVIPKPPQLIGKNAAGTKLWGPSGAGIWSAPTIDPERGLLYVATGDHYSDPEEGYGDSVVAMDMASGKIVWSQKLLRGDRWNVGCLAGDKVNCPKGAGPDFDFGSSPILYTLPTGQRVLLAGQKSGMLHFLDADRQGAIIRQVRTGTGGLLGGIEWGPAAGNARIYVASSDIDWKNQEAGGGLTAIQISTGERVWHVPAPKPLCLGEQGCSAAQPAAVTLIPGVVFTGSLDGHLRAYSTAEGRLIWDLDTRKAFPTVNKVPGRGGSMNAAGPTVVNGMLFVNSGYGMLGGAAGNVLLAYSVDE